MSMININKIQLKLINLKIIKKKSQHVHTISNAKDT